MCWRIAGVPHAPAVCRHDLSRPSCAQELCTLPTPAVFDSAWQNSESASPLLGIAGADGALRLFRADLREGGLGSIMSLLSAVCLVPQDGAASSPLCTSFGWAPAAEPGLGQGICSCCQDGSIHLLHLKEVSACRHDQVSIIQFQPSGGVEASLITLMRAGCHCARGQLGGPRA